MRTAVIAGDHIDCITTSPDAIKLTLSLKSDQRARNCPCFFASINMPIVISISLRVMLPLSGYLYSPIDSTTIAASIIPIDGMFKIDAFPLNSGFKSSAQVLIGLPIRSGLMPKVSALKTVGISVAHRVGSEENSLENSSFK